MLTFFFPSDAHVGCPKEMQKSATRNCLCAGVAAGGKAEEEGFEVEAS